MPFRRLDEDAVATVD